MTSLVGCYLLLCSVTRKFYQSFCVNPGLIESYWLLLLTMHSPSLFMDELVTLSVGNQISESNIE